jgi:uncharacterized protein YbcI
MSTGLGEAALDQIAISLAALYASLYESRPADARASLTGNMLAFVFEGGLSVADEWLLANGREEQLGKFRTQFFEVAGVEMTAVVGDLTGRPVTYSFTGFDPRTRTTHAIFVLDLDSADEAEERRAIINWSEQVRRNARRIKAEHVATRERHVELRTRVEEMRRGSEA